MSARQNDAWMSMTYLMLAASGRASDADYGLGSAPQIEAKLQASEELCQKSSISGGRGFQGRSQKLLR